MRALDRKLLRDLVRMWGQAITISLVVACGVASYVTMRATYVSILEARDRHYASERFADVFASIERAPESIAGRLERVAGIARLETRVVRDVLLPMPDMVEPAAGRVVSVPSRGAGVPALNALHVIDGRLPDPGRDDEAVVLDSFARAHDLRPGARVSVVLNGTQRDIRVVGTAMSPEFVFAVGRASFIQDARRFGVLWMTRDAVAAAFRMEGSFDDVAIALQPGASAEQVVADVRRELDAYGVKQVVARDRQMSNRILDGELSQLGTFAVVTPAIFLGVAAFLVNVVLARTLHLQRGQIAMLKAIGYRNREIAAHYSELVGVFVLAGAALGVALGALLGRGMIGLYRPYFRFPDLAFQLDPAVVAAGVVISVVTGFAGALSAVARAVRLPPAEAMLPESPATYRRPFFEHLGLHRLFGVSARMVLRELVRRPLRAVLSCVGIAFATSVVVCAYFQGDAMDLLIAQVFDIAQRDDVEVSFLHQAPETVLSEAKHLPHVLEAEGRRYVPVRVTNGARERELVLTTIDDVRTRPHPMRLVATHPEMRLDPPESGVLVSAKLADILGVRPGEHIVVELLEGDRRKVDVVVAGTVRDVFGLNLYASLDTVRRIAGEQGSWSSVLMTVDRDDEDALVERLAKTRNVAAVTRRSETYVRFLEQTRYQWVIRAVLTVFGAIIAFGVVYNQARIALSMRSRDLASLRVLGFLRSEISAILLGELAVYVVVGIPLGFAIGKLLVAGIMASVDPEGYRMPAIVTLRSYAVAAAFTIVAALASALVVRRKLDRLDLVAVLKTRE